MLRIIIITYLVICLCNLILYRGFLLALSKDKECAKTLMDSFGLDVFSVSSIRLRDYYCMLFPIRNILTFLSLIYCVNDFKRFKESIIKQGENKCN